MKKYITTACCVLLMCSCTPDGILDIGYGIRGGYDIGIDFALGSHISKAKADAAWKDCYNKSLTRSSDVIFSDSVEQCMHDKGLIRISDIHRRQKMAKQEIQRTETP